MSGSGSGGGGFSAADVACSALSFSTQIATPNPNLIVTIHVSEVLGIELVVMGGQQVVAVVKDTQLIGGLAGAVVSRLRDCINAGTRYRAIVTRVSGPLVVVRIEPIEAN